MLTLANRSVEALDFGAPRPTALAEEGGKQMDKIWELLRVAATTDELYMIVRRWKHNLVDAIDDELRAALMVNSRFSARGISALERDDALFSRLRNIRAIENTVRFICDVLTVI